ncbi:aldehyde dehydrogenase [Fusarium pseudoanthophilum]|uniref:aldehyde dehydrogenase (NAD(+)) n=1 Tax=Fusarium pseudoanthophilum TaxID=48495 RepID=A0A8H5KLA4_9HYPO|nr:aldehyde dehydrogenase [Fusarium pseudoanthophilum]
MRVKKVSFTGSVAIGENVLAAAAASNLRRYDQVKGTVDRALGQGDAKLLTSENPADDKGFWFSLAFIKLVKESKIVKKTFGLVSVLEKFKDKGKVMTLLERITASMDKLLEFFTRVINRALPATSEFEAGMVGINCISRVLLNPPFGGYKESGLGGTVVLWG